jgi:CheY-like chemotaxis protein
MPNKIAIVDDEPDVHTLTRLALKKMRFREAPVELFFLHSAADLIEHLRNHPDTGVILLDVVMEDEQAGLRAIESIRNELQNPLVRILLRTGQPGMAPEHEVIERYDIDGYLAKAEITSQRLFSSVRSALKNFDELQRLQHHRDTLWQVTQLMMSLTQKETPESCLQTLLHGAMLLLPAELCFIYLSTPAFNIPLLVQGSPDKPAALARAEAEQLHQILTEDAKDLAPVAQRFAKGYLFPIAQQGEHHSLGFFYLQRPQFSALDHQIATLLNHQTAFTLKHLMETLL